MRSPKKSVLGFCFGLALSLLTACHTTGDASQTEGPSLLNNNNQANSHDECVIRGSARDIGNVASDHYCDTSMERLNDDGMHGSDVDGRVRQSDGRDLSPSGSQYDPATGDSDDAATQETEDENSETAPGTTGPGTTAP